MCEAVLDPVSMDDAALNLSITDAWRDEAISAGRRLAAIAELTARRLGSELAAARELWGCDAVDSCAAEISCDLAIGHRAAKAMMHRGMDLRDRIPAIGDLLRRGEITPHVATTASWRTRLVTDPNALARIDADLAKVATRWGRYSDDKLIDAIDAAVERHDPDAVLRYQTAARGMNVQFGKLDDDTGTRSVYGRVSAADAEVSERRMQAMVNALCPNDPRTVGQRRTEAWGVIAAGGDHLPCLCGTSDCAAPTGPDARGRVFEIQVLTDDPHPESRTNDWSAPDDTPDDGGGPHRDPEYDWERHWTGDAPATDEPTEGPDAEPEHEAVAAAPCPYTAIIAGGGGILPAPLLADLTRMGASVRRLAAANELSATTAYRATIAQQRFVRARDMTCRFPGCDHPAEYCDVDHSTPHGVNGATHPSNLKALCRKHHLLKTFWVGRGGWIDEQLSDGTVVWTSPSGLTFHDPPGSRIFFPDWNTTTSLQETPPAATKPVPGREIRMPLRKRTRAQRHRDRVTAERTRNHDISDQNPPPF